MSTVINGKVYFGGGSSANTSDEYIVYQYNPSQDNWTTLPPLPVRYFGLGQMNGGQLVAIGGKRVVLTKCLTMYTHITSDLRSGNRLFLRCQQLESLQVS